MSDDSSNDWKKDLYRLLTKIGGLGIKEDVENMTEKELWDLYQTLKRAEEDEWHEKD